MRFQRSVILFYIALQLNDTIRHVQMYLNVSTVVDDEKEESRAVLNTREEADQRKDR